MHGDGPATDPARDLAADMESGDEEMPEAAPSVANPQQPSLSPPMAPLGSDGCQVQVAVRIRPLLPKEEMEDARVCMRIVDDRQVVLGKDRSFTFDTLFGPHATQEDVYGHCVLPLMEKFFKGYNCTIFAYGQTGTGKTHTMGTGDMFNTTPEVQGIVPRVISNIFATLERKKQEAEMCSKTMSFRIKVSYIEIYNEVLKDLLSPNTAPRGIQIREDTDGSIVVVGVREEEIETYEDMIAQLESGTLARTTGATMMNELSSRSHSILTVIVEQRYHNPNDKLAPNDFTISKLHLVDLAGSERNKKTQAVGQRFKESVSINCGLLALGNVISVLADEKKGDKKVHVPYRESKLTRLLQDSLGGTAHTLMIACVSPADTNIEESLNTLKYANRAKNIRNKPIVNRDPHAMQIAQLRSELQMCRALLNKHGIEYEEGADMAFPAKDNKNAIVTLEGDVITQEMWEKLKKDKMLIEEEVLRLRAHQRNHNCWDVFAQEGDDVFGELLDAISGVDDGAKRSQLASLVGSMERKLKDRRPNHATTAPATPPPTRRRNHSEADGKCRTVKRPLAQRQQQQRAPDTPATRTARRHVSHTPRGRTQPSESAAVSPAVGKANQDLRRVIPSSMLASGRIPATYNPPDPNAPPHVVSAHAEQIINENQKLLRNLKQLEDDLFKSEYQAMQENEEKAKLQSAMTEAREENLHLKHLNERLVKRVDELEQRTADVDRSSVKGSPAKEDDESADVSSTQELLDNLTKEVNRLEMEKEQLWQAKIRTECEKAILEKNAESAHRAFVNEHQALQQQLKALASDIDQKTSMVAELIERERRAEQTKQQSEKVIMVMESERERMKHELDKALKRLEASDLAESKLERKRNDLRRHYEHRLKEQDVSLQELRRRQRESQALLRQHTADSQKLQKLRTEVLTLKSSQEDLKAQIKTKSDFREAERDKSQRQLIQLQRQIKQLESENNKYSMSLKGKEDAVVRLQQQLNVEKTRAKRLAEQQAELKREVDRKQSWLDREIDIQKKKKEAQDRLQRELRRRERILKEREDNLNVREDMRRTRDEKDLGRLQRGLQGWHSQILSIEGKLAHARAEVQRIPVQARNQENDGYTEALAAVVHLENSLEAAKAKYREIYNAQAEAEDLDNQLRQIDDRIDVLQAALDYGEDIIVQTEKEIAELTQAGEEIRKTKGEVREESCEANSSASPSRPGRLSHRSERTGEAEDLPSAATDNISQSTSSPDRTPVEFHMCDGSGEQTPSEGPMSYEQYQQTLLQYAKKVLALNQSEAEKEKEIRNLRLKIDEQNGTIEKFKNALKLCDMGFNRRLLKVQMEYEKILSKLVKEDQGGNEIED